MHSGRRKGSGYLVTLVVTSTPGAKSEEVTR